MAPVDFGSSMKRSAFHNTLVVTCLVQAGCVFGQGVLAGSFLSGNETSVALHEVGGWVTFAVALVQALLLLLPQGRVYGLWLLVTSIGIAVAEVLQLGTGYGRFLGVHIPLAVLLVGALVWQVTWILRFPVRAR